METKDGLTIWEDHFYPEVIDPETGAVLPDAPLYPADVGKPGAVVVTGWVPLSGLAALGITVFMGSREPGRAGGGDGGAHRGDAPCLLGVALICDAERPFTGRAPAGC